MPKPKGPVFDSEWRRSCVVAPVSKADADWCIRRHYLGRWPGVVVLRLGAFREGTLLGCIVFALPPRESNKRYGGVVWELARLWLDDTVPANAETWLMGAATRYIKRNHKDVQVLLTYADPSAGHAGTIYKAANWTSDGRTDDERKTPRFDYADAVTGRKYSRRGHVPNGTQIIRVPRVSKHRFILRLRNSA